MLLNTTCIRLNPTISDQIRPTFFSASSPNRFPDRHSALDDGGWRTVQPACPPKRFWQRRVRLVLPVRPSPTQSNPVQPNPTTPLPPVKEIGKETACPPECFRRRRVNFLAIFDHLSLRPLVPLVENRTCADIVAIRDLRLLNNRAGRRSNHR